MDENLDNPTWQFMQPYAYGPVLRTPITDITSATASKLERSKYCGHIEMMMLNCLEQYGWNKGKTACKGFLMDYGECHNQAIQKKRVLAMQAERKRQIKAGELKTPYEPAPPLDAY